MTAEIGLFAKGLDPAFAEAAGLGGADFVILDREHGPASLAQIHDLVRAVKAGGARAFVRVPANLPHEIGGALDSGADGVLVPNVPDAAAAQAAIEAARFHPLGKRGTCRFVRAADYGLQDDYFAAANRATLVLQVEGREAVAQLDEILALDGFDVLFVGPYDLSQSLGVPGRIDAPDVIETISDIVARAGKAGKRVGIFCDTPDGLARWREAGIQFIACSVDVAIYREAVGRLLKGEA